MSLRAAIFDAFSGAGEASELDEEVRAELDHHLALATERLLAQGLPESVARRQALQRFGNYDTIRRACLHANLKGALMLRKVHAATTIALLVAVIALIGTNYAQTGRLRAEAERAREVARNAMQAMQERENPGVLLVEVGDRVTFVPTYNPELALTETVALDGKLLVPSAGWVHVLGKSREEAERLVTEALEPYYQNVEIRLKVQR